MQIILSSQVEYLTGMLDKTTGYFIVPRKSKNGKTKFWGVQKKGNYPENGHLRFIIQCAKLAQTKLYATDVKVSSQELWLALRAAHKFQAAQVVLYNEKHSIKTTYDARDVINLVNTFLL